jgi:hypothetical protein
MFAWQPALDHYPRVFADANVQPNLASLLTTLACDLSTSLRRTTDTLRDLWDVRS